MTSHLFVGSYGPADEPGIHIFSLDESHAELRLQGTTAGVHNASFLALHPAGDRLFAVSETGGGADAATGGAVHAFQIVPDDGTLALVARNHRATAGDYPCHLSIDGGGSWLAVSNYGTGNLGVFPIGADGSLGEMAGFVQHSGRGPNPHRQEGPHAHSAVFTPDNRFLIAADLGIDRLLIHAFDPSTGSLAEHGEAVAQSGAGPRHMAFHPDGRHLFVVNELDNTVTLYRYERGRLRPRQTVSTLPAAAAEGLSAEIRAASSGRHVYVSTRGPDTVTAFAFDPGQGLERIVTRSCGGKWPRHFALTPSGRHLLVANRHSDEIALLPLFGGGSDIGERVARAPVAQPSCVVFA